MKQPGEWNKDIEYSVKWLLKYAYGADNANGEGKEQFIKEYLLKKEEDDYNPEMFITPESAENKYNNLRIANIVCLLYELEKLNETVFCPLCYSTINKEEEK